MPETVNKKKIALLSNVTVDLIIGKLSRKYDMYQPEGFDTWVQEVINPSSNLYKCDVDAVVLLLDGTEARDWNRVKEGIDRIELWKNALNTLLENNSSIPVFITTLDIRENRIKSMSERKMRYELENDWYQFVQNLIEAKDNVYIIDLADVISDIGRKSFYSNKMWYMSNMPYSREGLNAVIKEMNRALDSLFEARKKIIALDLDNTLWGGVVGEDGIDGIELSNHKEGQRYYDFQRQLLEMKNRGVVLGICSKNNEEDAEFVIDNHSSMLLRDKDFVSKKINWNNKTTNLKAMEDELNISEGGFIFIDDNPMEQETVRGECVDMLVPGFPEESSELLSFAEEIWFDYCRPLRVLGDDTKKTEMYLSEEKRKTDKNKSISLDDYIAKLEMVVDIHKMRDDELKRVVQLINKTNQFNVTTKRYTQKEIEEINQNPNNSIYVTYCSDKYGDSGLISVVILMNEDDSTAIIDTFLMSCRVMGRKLEEVLINEMASCCNGKTLIGEYIPTSKNKPVKDLYETLGFELISEEDDHKKYKLKTLDYKKKEFACYKEIRFEG